MQQKSRVLLGVLFCSCMLVACNTIDSPSRSVNFRHEQSILIPSSERVAVSNIMSNLRPINEPVRITYSPFPRTPIQIKSRAMMAQDDDVFHIEFSGSTNMVMNNLNSRLAFTVEGFSMRALVQESHYGPESGQPSGSSLERLVAAQGSTWRPIEPERLQELPIPTLRVIMDNRGNVLDTGLDLSGTDVPPGQRELQESTIFSQSFLYPKLPQYGVMSGDILYSIREPYPEIQAVPAFMDETARVRGISTHLGRRVLVVEWTSEISGPGVRGEGFGVQILDLATGAMLFSSRSIRIEVVAEGMRHRAQKEQTLSAL